MRGLESGVTQRPQSIRGQFWPKRWTVKTKLMVTASIPLLLLIPMVASLLWSAGQAAYTEVLVSKVRSDLVLAQQVFDGAQKNKLQELRAWAESANLRNFLLANKISRGGRLPESYLDAQTEKLGLSYLRMVGQDGKILNASPESALTTQQILDPSSLEKITSQSGSVHIALLSSEDLAAISTDLAKQAKMPIVPTPNATADERTLETRGLVMQVVNPLYLDGVLLGWLEGGVLLNGNLEFVDSLNELVYPTGSLLDGSFGTATLFLDDVRISTTVRSSDDTRAIGTRVSDQVKERVLGRGEIWQNRAYVVDDWFMSGYAPLISSAGQRIGMLYVGYLEAPYAAIKKRLLILFLFAVGVAMAIGAVLVGRLSGGIFYPLRRMNYIMSRQEGGDAQARVGSLQREDEFSDLASHFDALLDQLDTRRGQLERLNLELDSRVSQRTADLHAANQKLHQAVEQLLASEKLALMGQLTAGLAHEFNNPLAVMMGHLDLLRISISDPANQANLRLLDEQVNRMRNIVQKLLQFCRPDEYASYSSELDVHDVIQDGLLFAKAELEQSKVRIHKIYKATQPVQISPTELQQVMVNLFINAAHALEHFDSSPHAADDAEPTLTLLTNDIQLPDGQAGVMIVVENNGLAISNEQLGLIFKMFYTTKREGRGTGLGLPVSQMLLQRYGGDLKAQSPVFPAGAPPNPPPTYGARFEVILRCKAKPSADILRESNQQASKMGQQILEGN
ncbi:MAG: cache domain-containing protein [Limnobacter sp.]|nr:cache domain-containing protein [Limnobacter sp.]